VTYGSKITPLTDELEEYKDHPRYVDLKMALHMNLLLRLLRMDKKEDRGDLILDVKMFFIRILTVLTICMKSASKGLSCIKSLPTYEKAFSAALERMLMKAWTS